MDTASRTADGDSTEAPAGGSDVSGKNDAPPGLFPQEAGREPGDKGQGACDRTGYMSYVPALNADHLRMAARAEKLP